MTCVITSFEDRILAAPDLATLDAVVAELDTAHPGSAVAFYAQYLIGFADARRNLDFGVRYGAPFPTPPDAVVSPSAPKAADARP